MKKLPSIYTNKENKTRTIMESKLNDKHQELWDTIDRAGWAAHGFSKSLRGIIIDYIDKHIPQSILIEQKGIKTPKELISNMYTNAANLKHIAETGVINGSLLIDIENVMKSYAAQFYTQEQMLAFGEAVLKEAADSVNHSKRPNWNKESILNINLTDILTK